MELRHLQYFLAVAETQHFGQAAERLHMAQSPLSQAIRQLETHVGARLFDRTTRRVELTAAGEALLSDARRILDAVEAARTRVGLVANGSTGMLRVGGIRLLDGAEAVPEREQPLTWRVCNLRPLTSHCITGEDVARALPSACMDKLE